MKIFKKNESRHDINKPANDKQQYTKHSACVISGQVAEGGGEKTTYPLRTKNILYESLIRYV